MVSNEELEQASRIEAEATAPTAAKEDKGQNSAENLAALQAALAQSTEKAEENWQQFLRAKAETENARKRAQLDIENAHKYSIERLARELLAVIDSLEQGLQVKVEGEAAQSLHQGMELTLKLLLGSLDKFGIKPVSPEGQVFNPSLHEALSTAPSDGEANRVLTVIQKGYSLQERVLRPARVIVSRPELTPSIETEA